MEKRILGILLTFLGIVGLVFAGITFMKGDPGGSNFRSIVVGGIVGAIFFFAGISLIRNTTDKPT